MARRFDKSLHACAFVLLLKRGVVEGSQWHRTRAVVLKAKVEHDRASSWNNNNHNKIQGRFVQRPSSSRGGAQSAAPQ